MRHNLSHQQPPCAARPTRAKTPAPRWPGFQVNNYNVDSFLRLLRLALSRISCLIFALQARFGRAGCQLAAQKGPEGSIVSMKMASSARPTNATSYHKHSILVLARHAFRNLTATTGCVQLRPGFASRPEMVRRAAIRGTHVQRITRRAAPAAASAPPAHRPCGPGAAARP